MAASFISNQAACALDRAAFGHDDRHRAEAALANGAASRPADRPFTAVSGTEQTQWNINRSLNVGEGAVVV